ncbi:MAG: hypothetical protein ABIV51_03885, partial [Saprospiraceae bacterium]
DKKVKIVEIDSLERQMVARVEMFRKFKNIEVAAFAEILGTSISNFRNIAAKNSIRGFDQGHILTILQTYHELDANWLMRGTGSMMYSPSNRISELNDPAILSEISNKLDKLMETIQMK